MQQEKSFNIGTRRAELREAIIPCVPSMATRWVAYAYLYMYAPRYVCMYVPGEGLVQGLPTCKKLYGKSGYVFTYIAGETSVSGNCYAVLRNRGSIVASQR